MRADFNQEWTNYTFLYGQFKTSLLCSGTGVIIESRHVKHHYENKNRFIELNKPVEMFTESSENA